MFRIQTSIRTKLAFYRPSAIRHYFSLFLGITSCLFSTMVFANTVKKNHVEAELIAEVKSVKPSHSFWIGVRLKMDPKWHTYWKNPGDAGLPTSIDWNLPEGFRASSIFWPYPERFNTSGIISQGYKGEVVLLTKIDVGKSVPINRKISLGASIHWLECKEICLPGHAELKLTLPVTDDRAPEIDTRWTTLFFETRAKIPLNNSEWSFQAGRGEKGTIQILASAPRDLNYEIGEVVFFPDKDLPVKLDGHQAWEKISEKKFSLILELLQSPETPPENVSGVFVGSRGWRGPDSEKALQIKVPIMAGAITHPLAEDKAMGNDLSLPFAFLLAFFGGIILNLMPCVFPVISLKVLGFVNQAQEDPTKVWRYGLVFTAGVLLSFWILGGAMLAIRAGGEQIGWGFQLQSPVFVICLAILMFLLALNLFGVYEIGLFLTRSGSALQGKSGWSESFLSGVLATLIATPCTAPFMAAALGFALSQPPATSMGIFTFLGLGMASPYLLLSRFQSLMRFIPRPGPWMESFKQLMGFLLMASVVWLLWLLQILAGSQTLINLLGGFLVIAIATWIYGRWGSAIKMKGIRFPAIITALFLFAAGVAYPIKNVPENKPSEAPKEVGRTDTGTGIEWQGFTAEKVRRLRSEGKRVFIDFTAAWCLSCLANERVAFSSKRVQEKFKELNITPIKADWTHRNEEITRELAKFGRSGVPFYILYDGGRKADPIILPEILTPGIVLNALDKLEKINENVKTKDI